MLDKTLTEISQALSKGDVSSLELTQGYLDRIDRMDDQINSFITLTPELALAQAQKADAARAKGDVHPLSGVPLAHKDIFCTQGVRTSCGSKMLDNFKAPYNASVIERFNKVGAVSLGKTNLDEFAMGSSTESSFYGPTRNPWALDKVPGGSSGGAAAVIAAGFAAGATGTDTGGSIRQPAAFCGISGIKPTYGRVSRWGMIAYGSSLDQAGPMAKSCNDLALMLETMAGFDHRDSTCVDRPVPAYSQQLNQDIRGLRIGLPKEYFGEGLDPRIAKLVHEAVATLKARGAIIKEISLPRTHLAIPAYYIIAPAEASTNLSRFDGVKFGHRADQPKDLLDMYLRSRAEGFGLEVKRRILIGTYALSAGYYDAYYRKAQQLRRLIKDDFVNALAEVDVIAGPATPNLPWSLGAKDEDPVAMYLEDLYTIAVNLAGLPGMSVPCGFVDGLPVGLQLIGNYFAEAQLLNLGHQYQQDSSWHLQQPQQFAQGGN